MAVTLPVAGSTVHAVVSYLYSDTIVASVYVTLGDDTSMGPEAKMDLVASE